MLLGKKYKKKCNSLRASISYYKRKGQHDQADEFAKESEELKIQHYSTTSAGSNPTTSSDSSTLVVLPCATEGTTPHEKKEWFLELALITELKQAGANINQTTLLLKKSNRPSNGSSRRTWSCRITSDEATSICSSQLII
eukprot:scaffold1001_cov169-Amphora_coffeaeformis.AAC.32